VKFNKDKLTSHELFATGTTGKLVEEFLGMPVQKLMSGHWVVINKSVQ
jgi:methylglyoxal synthase